MPKYAVLLTYEVTSGLFVEADSEDEAARIATEFEATTHDLDDADESGPVRIIARHWGDGTLEPEEVADFEEAEEVIESWIDEDEDDDDDLAGEDDEYDELDDDEDDDAADELDDDHEPGHDGDEVDDDFDGELDEPARR